MIKGLWNLQRMKIMNEELQNLTLFEILEKYTSLKGNYMLQYNDHKSCYCDTTERIIDYYFSEDLEEAERIQKEYNISFHPKDDIYKLYWYNLSPVGYYTLYANSIQDLKQSVIKLIDHNQQEFKMSTIF